MTSDPQPPLNVFLLHDASQNIEPIRAALAHDGFRVETSTSLAIAAANSGKESLAALLINAGGTNDPKVTLAREWRANSLFRSALILLCPGTMTPEAYRLCRDGTFDDYVSVEPLDDAYRLRLAIVRAQALRKYEHLHSELDGLAAEFAVLRSFTATASEQLAEGWRDLLPMLGGTPKEPARTVGSVETSRTAFNAGPLLACSEELRSRNVATLDRISNELTQVHGSIARMRQANRRVLLVDDDPVFFELMDQATASLNYRLYWTTEPHETVRLVREVRPVCVLLDVDMPGMSGIEVLRAIRNEATIATTPVILVTAQRRTETVLAARDLKVNGYIVKPPALAEIESKLRAITQLERTEF